MKKYIVFGLVAVFGVSLFGCGKKQVSFEDQEPLSMEALSTINTNQTMAEVKVAESKMETAVVTPAATASVKLEALPPTGPYKPTAVEIQTALKNAGFYTGEADGKIGPMSRRAIEAFQKANNLQADGRVGPKTWALLSKYLNPAVSTPETAAPVKRR